MREHAPSTYAVRAHRAYIPHLSIFRTVIYLIPGSWDPPLGLPRARGIYIRESGSAHGIGDVQQCFFFYNNSC